VNANGNVTDDDTYTSLNAAMSEAGQSWCDRCRVFALHSPFSNPPPPAPPATPLPLNVQTLFSSCVADGLIARSLGSPPPEASLRLDANRCVPCAANETSDSNGVCQFCPNIVVGNSCVECPADVVFDGESFNGASLNAGAVAAGDRCPQLFFAQITRPVLLATRGLDVVAALEASNNRDRQRCEQPFSLLMARDLGAASLSFEPPAVAIGSWTSNQFGSFCSPLVVSRAPSAAFLGAASSVWFGTPTDPRVTMRLDVDPTQPH